METIYNDIPEPIGDDLRDITTNIDELIEYSVILLTEQLNDENELIRLTDKESIILMTNSTDYRRRAKTFFKDVIKKDRGVWEDRFLKMTICVYNHITKTRDDALMQILGISLLAAFQNCSNRKSTEIERLYFTYVAPDRLKDYEAIATAQETLTFELMQHRRNLRDGIINTICNDMHNAASHRFYCAKLNEKIFYLPPAVLCEADGQHAEYAMTHNHEEERIIKAFKDQYESPNAIYDFFTQLLYSKQGEKFKRDMFVGWLEKTGRMNPDAFIDDEWLKQNGRSKAEIENFTDYTVYKPELIVEYLASNEKGFEMGFLQKK
jgi:hypothetical protein